MTAYWEQYEPSLESMMLSADAAKLDLAEKEEILSYLPVIKGKTVLELGSGIGYVLRNHNSFFQSSPIRFI